jgi:hypothetical protein
LIHRGPAKHTERILDIPHILEKTIDDLEGLRRSYPSLILSEPIQPLKYRLDVLPPEELLLDKRFCVA